MVQLLLEASAFVEEQNENGHTPLMEAASGGHIGKGVFTSSVMPPNITISSNVHIRNMEDDMTH